MKPGSKSAVVIFLLGCLLSFGVLASILLIALYFPETGVRPEALVAVEKITSFRQIQGRLPEALKEIGVPDDQALYYEKRADGSYELGYGRALGSSTYYDSREGKWKEVD